MIKNIKKEFTKLLQANNWMDNETKAYALEKLTKLDYLVGYPDFILDDKRLDDFYSELKITVTDSFIYAYGKALRFLNDYSYKQLNQPVNRNEFTQSVAQINAFYQPSFNNISGKMILFD